MASDHTKKRSTAPLFLGFEHAGLYPLRASADRIATWYEENFGFRKSDETASYFLSGPGAGRLEIMKSPYGNAHAHVAIRVSNFEEAMEELRSKGIRFREPIIQPDLKIVYLEDPDPEGNPVHLWWGR